MFLKSCMHNLYKERKIRKYMISHKQTNLTKPHKDKTVAIIELKYIEFEKIIVSTQKIP